MAKLGRPKAEVTKEKVVSIRMKADDYEKVKRYAQSSKQTVTQVMQEGVMRLIQQETSPKDMA